MTISILVSDFLKPEESKLCLESIKKFITTEHEVIFLSNSGLEDYVLDFYKSGLIDRLIINKKNSGGGNAAVDLFAVCNNHYSLFLQNDQELIREISPNHIENFIQLLNNGYSCIDLAGAVGGQNIYSERLHFINVDFYNSIYKGEKGAVGGPGPFNFNKYSEGWIQEYFKNNNLKIAHLGSYVKDNGVWSVREIGDGLYRHRCDTKQFYVLKIPTYITTEYPPFDLEIEWPKVLKGEWRDGDIPLKWQPHSFRVWPDK